MTQQIDLIQPMCGQRGPREEDRVLLKIDHLDIVLIAWKHGKWP